MADLSHESNSASDSDSDDSSSIDGAGVEMSDEDMNAMMAFEQELEKNPKLYDKHIEYIALLRKCRLRERLCEAHEKMADHFPLSEQLWTEWVNDELKHVESTEDVQRIQKLFGRAVKDYFSVTLWISYLEFVAEFESTVQERSPEGLKHMRELCENGLTAVGLHVMEGAKIWAIYRKFELAVEAKGQGGDKQQDKVRQLFHRQLQVPLEDGEATLAAYVQWESKHAKDVPPHIMKAHTKAQEAAQLRMSYETAVSADKAPDANVLAAFLAYVKLEQAQGDPARVQCIYERAISVFPVTHELWVQYARYLETNLKIPSVVHSVYSRAVRNCYWVGVLWARAIRALSRLGVPSSEPAARLALAEQAHLYSQASYEDYMEVVLARLDGLRMAVQVSADDPSSVGHKEALRSGFKECSKLLTSYFPDYLDRTLKIPSYWSNSEAHVMQSVDAARKVWEEVLKTGLGRYCEAWAAFASMERSCRNLTAARAVYKRAVARKGMEEGGTIAMATAWLQFEQQEGSGEEYFQAALKVEPILEEAAAASAAEANVQVAAAAKAAAAKQAPKLSPEEMTKLRERADPNLAAAKQAPKLSPEEMTKLRQMTDPNFKSKAKAAAAPQTAPSTGIHHRHLWPLATSDHATQGNDRVQLSVFNSSRGTLAAIPSSNSQRRLLY
eukprot:gene21550-28543_t